MGEAAGEHAVDFVTERSEGCQLSANDQGGMGDLLCAGDSERLEREGGTVREPVIESACTLEPDTPVEVHSGWYKLVR